MSRRLLCCNICAGTQTLNITALQIDGASSLVSSPVWMDAGMELVCVCVCVFDGLCPAGAVLLLLAGAVLQTLTHCS